MGESIAPESARRGRELGGGNVDAASRADDHPRRRAPEGARRRCDGRCERCEDALEMDYYVRQDQLRQKLCDYIMADFPAR